MNKYGLMAVIGGIFSMTTPTSASAFGAMCACEHYGSQYDGICEAWPQTGDETYSWTAHGSAYFPYPPDSYSGGVYYDKIRSSRESAWVSVVITKSNGESDSTACAFGTPGG